MLKIIFLLTLTGLMFVMVLLEVTIILILASTHTNGAQSIFSLTGQLLKLIV
nr:MAG TPA: hypothetical protein [Caudoviricetes sp.]